MELKLRPDYALLYAAEDFKCKSDLRRKGLSVAYLRAICKIEGVATTRANGKDIARGELEHTLAEKLGLEMKRRSKTKEFNEQVKMNLHRLNQLFFLIAGY